MNDKLKMVIKVLLPYRKIALIVIFLLAVIIVCSFIFLSPAKQNAIVIPCLLAMLWCLLFYLIVVFLHAKATQFVLASGHKSHVFKRLKMAVLRGFYYCLTWLLLLLTLAISILTFRILNTWV